MKHILWPLGLVRRADLQFRNIIRICVENIFGTAHVCAVRSWCYCVSKLRIHTIMNHRISWQSFWQFPSLIEHSPSHRGENHWARQKFAEACYVATRLRAFLRSTPPPYQRGHPNWAKECGSPLLPDRKWKERLVWISPWSEKCKTRNPYCPWYAMIQVQGGGLPWWLATPPEVLTACNQRDKDEHRICLVNRKISNKSVAVLLASTSLSVYHAPRTAAANAKCTSLKKTTNSQDGYVPRVYMVSWAPVQLPQIQWKSTTPQFAICSSETKAARKFKDHVVFFNLCSTATYLQLAHHPLCFLQVKIQLLVLHHEPVGNCHPPYVLQVILTSSI